MAAGIFSIVFWPVGLLLAVIALVYINDARERGRYRALGAIGISLVSAIVFHAILS